MLFPSRIRLKSFDIMRIRNWIDSIGLRRMPRVVPCASDRGERNEITGDFQNENPRPVDRNSAFQTSRRFIVNSIQSLGRGSLKFTISRADVAQRTRSRCNAAITSVARGTQVALCRAAIDQVSSICVTTASDNTVLRRSIARAFRAYSRVG